MHSQKTQFTQDYWFRKLVKKTPIFNFNSGEYSELVMLSKSLSPRSESNLKQITNNDTVAQFTVFLFLFSFLLRRYFGESAEFVIRGLGVGRNSGVPSYGKTLFYSPDFSLTLSIREMILKVKEEIEQTSKFSTFDEPDLFSALTRSGFDLRALDEFSLSVAASGSQDEESNNEFLQLILEDGKILKVRYNSGIIDSTFVENLLRHIDRLLETLPNNLSAAGTAVDILTLEEKHMLLIDFNTPTISAGQDVLAVSSNSDVPSVLLAARRSSPTEDSIHTYFERQAQKTPDAIALAYEGHELTYQELNQKSNQLARHILEEYQRRTGYELRMGTLIPLHLERSLEMVVGILSILKCGGAYVPIDTTFPQDRIDYLLQDTGAELILSQHGTSRLSGRELPEDKVVHIDLSEELYKNTNRSNLNRTCAPSDLAYVIYTSGTTGKPKGVMLNHAGIVNRIEWMQSQYPLDENDVVLQKTPYVFDVSVWELLWANWYGAKIVIAKPDGHKDCEYLQHLIESNQVTTVHFVPSMLEVFNLFLSSQANKFSDSLRLMFCSGEALSGHVVNATYKNASHPNFKLHNLYGPTEASIDVTSFETSPGKKVYIGKPIRNTKAYVLDPYHHPMPVGMIGELYLSGIALARGYLNNTTLSAQRFIPNPFLPDSANHSRLYKTGDLVRWMPDGNLEFIGRNDNQIKIRGYRVELEEIEHAIRAIPGINLSCVLAKDRSTGHGNNKYLVGYYVAEPEAREMLDEETLLRSLHNVLPEYMVPAYLIEMASFPLTTNGKLNKSALPEPDLSGSYVAPATDLENTICEIYSRILGLSSREISVRQNFFRIGGNSILLISLKNELSRLHQFRHIRITDLFKYDSIEKLIKSLENTTETTYKLHGESPKQRMKDIAIIGMSGAFSSADTVDQLWQLLVSQKEGLQFYNTDECRELQVHELALKHPNFIPVAGRVTGIELFDPLFWEMSPQDAKVLNPQIRKFIENSWFALESAGYAHQRKLYNIGVFAGSNDSDYLSRHVLSDQEVNPWEASIANVKDALATKTAFYLGLTGPANAINTACSTSLVSIIEACKSIQMGDCNMALAGGVAFSQSDPIIGYVHSEGSVFSKDGHTRVFDSKASGAVFSQGVGVVLLKPLEAAIKDCDNIFAVIKGYATNNDGDRKTGYTAPSIVGQSECIINAQEMAGIKPNEVDYIECHGTATNLGDPIEVRALREAFEYRKSSATRLGKKTILGAVKANIGHTGAAAGSAGVIKVCLMFQNNIIPGQVNFDEPNPELNLHETDFVISSENKPWQAQTNKHRFAAVSSFGIGGTNAHIILSDYIPKHKTLPASSQHTTNDGKKFIIPISGKNRQALDSNRRSLLEHLQKRTDHSDLIFLRDLAFTLQEKREHFNYRCAFPAVNVSELLRGLAQNTSYSRIDGEEKNKVVFMFPGQGAQYVNMAKPLYDNEEFFRNTVNHCVSLANQYLTVDLHDVLFPKDAIHHDISDIQWSPISLFTIEFSLAKYLNHLGVFADAYIGHSFGEYAAATLAGVFSLDDAIRIIIARGKVMQEMPEGAMLAISAPIDSVVSIVHKFGCDLSVINSHEDVVASGTEADIRLLQEELDNLSISSVRINATVAGHSKLMNGATEKFRETFQNVQLHKSARLFMSNLTGEAAGEEVTTADYWCNQLRNPVQFSKGIERLNQRYHYKLTYLELGPGKGLCYFVNKHKNLKSTQSAITVQLLASSKESSSEPGGSALDVVSGEDILAKLWMSNVIEKPNDPVLLSDGKLLSFLPGYQFNYTRCWFEKEQTRRSEKFNSLNELFYRRSWERDDLNQFAYTDNLRKKNILVLISGQEEDGTISNLLNTLRSCCDSVIYVINRGENDLDPARKFDFANPTDVTAMLNARARRSPLDLVVYVSSSVDLDLPAIDIVAVRNIFNWSDNTRNKISKFVSVAFDNYEVLGTEPLGKHPSLVYGITKSIPFEYFNSETKVLHLDLSATDNGSEKKTLLHLLSADITNDLAVVRGKYHWLPKYLQVNLPDQYPGKSTADGEDGAVFLITGGLGGIGYACAKHLSQKAPDCKLILLGRSNEEALRKDYRAKLSQLRADNINVVYISMDIGEKDIAQHLVRLLNENNISKIDVVLHAAGVVAKSAAIDKTRTDIDQVVFPKVIGIENLIKLSDTVRIQHLVMCSSLSSIVPKLGNMEYTAANLYLDEKSYRSYPNIGNILAININQISDTGAAVEFNQNGSVNEVSWNSIESTEFANILEKLLGLQLSTSLCLSRGDIDARQFDHLKLVGNQRNLQTDTYEVTVTDEGYTDAEYKIAQVVAEILGLREISIYDDFFRLGGNSIVAIKISHRISKLLGLELKVADIFKHKTISQIVQHKYALEKKKTIEPANVKECSLSFAQERLWFIEQYEKGSSAYHIHATFQLENEVDIEAVKHSLQQIVARHEVLRTTIEHRPDKGNLQVIHESALPILEEHVSDNIDHDAIFRAEISKPFDLSSDFPIRVKFYTFSSNELSREATGSKRVLLIVMHHISCDGWSTEIFQKELFSFYSAYVNRNQNPGLPALEIQYKDYALWQRSYLKGDVLEQQLNYWKGRLAGYAKLDLPLDYQRPKKVDYRGAVLPFGLMTDLSNRLRDMAQLYEVSLHSILLSALDILLYKYTGQLDIVVGSPIANRHHVELENLIGFFVNTQVNRVILNKTQNFADLVTQVHLEQTAAQLHQDLPFEKLVDVMSEDRDTSRHPIFQVMFAVQSFGTDRSIKKHQDGLFKPYSGNDLYQVEKFDLSIVVNDSADVLSGKMSYATSLFKKETISRLIDHYVYLLEQVTKFPRTAYSELSLLRKDEYNFSISDLNNTTVPHPRDRTLSELFQAQVLSTPDNVALHFRNSQLTYRQLNEKSNQLARMIRQQRQSDLRNGFKSDSFVALCLSNSLEMVVAMLAVLKAGAAYVVIDEKHPQNRIDRILADADISLLLTHRQSGLVITDQNILQVYLEDDTYCVNESSNLPSYATADDLAYVIYTSGTTGKPKGTMVEHNSVTNLSLTIVNQFRLDERTISSQLMSTSFDASVSEIYPTLLSGGTLVLLPNSSKQNATMLLEELTSNKITHLTISADFLATVPWVNLIHLKSIHVGGSVPTKESLEKWSRNRLLINAYGPTECTVCVAMHVFQEGDLNSNIGKPIDNNKLYILDEFLQPVPIGVKGELYISGAGVARGYLNNEEATIERFISNPYYTEGTDAEWHKRLYKTGDYARRLANGDVEYLGREDTQVKVNSYRIELGEIEHALTSIIGIKQGCILVKENAGNLKKYIVGYYSLDRSDRDLSRERIAQKLLEILPQYMMPAELIRVEAFQFTGNGKIDRRALPAIENDLADRYVPPCTDTEQSICKIWKEILRLDRIGTTDNFFRVGGNSLLAISTISRMHSVLSIELSVRELFICPTIQMISSLVDERREQKGMILSHQTNEEYSYDNEGWIEALPMQAWRYLEYKEYVEYKWGFMTHKNAIVFDKEGRIERILLMNRSLGPFRDDSYKQYFKIKEGDVLQRVGIYPQMNSIVVRNMSHVNKSALNRAINTLVSRHDSLRAVFKDSDGKVFLKITEPNAILFDVLFDSAPNSEIGPIIKEMREHLFNFQNEYSFKCKLVEHDHEQFTLIVVIDHIIYDGESIKIIENELFTLYDAYCKGLPNPLSPLNVQFKDYLKYYHQHYRGEKLLYHHDYFKNLFKKLPEKLTIRSFGGSSASIVEVPAESLSMHSSKGAGYIFAINKDVVDAIQVLRSDFEITVFNVLISAYAVFLKNISFQRDFVIDTPISTRINEDFSKIVGWLNGVLISRIEVEEDASFLDLLFTCKNSILSGMDHIFFQDLDGALNSENTEGYQPIARDRLISAQLNVIEDTDRKNMAPVAPRHYIAGHVSSDINFNITVYADGMQVNCTYKSNAIPPAEIEVICAIFQNVLSAAVVSPKDRIKDLIVVTT